MSNSKVVVVMQLICDYLDDRIKFVFVDEEPLARITA